MPQFLKYDTNSDLDGPTNFQRASPLDQGWSILLVRNIDLRAVGRQLCRYWLGKWNMHTLFIPWKW